MELAEIQLGLVRCVKRLLTSSGNSHFDPERGRVVQTSRNTPAQDRAVRHIHALRLVLRTQPRSAK